MEAYWPHQRGFGGCRQAETTAQHNHPAVAAGSGTYSAGSVLLQTRNTYGEQLFAARERSRQRRWFALTWHFFVAFCPHYDNVPFTQPAWYAVKNCTVVVIALRAELLRINLKRHTCIRCGERVPAPPAFLLAQGNFERPRPARADPILSRRRRGPLAMRRANCRFAFGLGACKFAYDQLT